MLEIPRKAPQWRLHSVRLNASETFHGPFVLSRWRTLAFVHSSILRLMNLLHYDGIGQITTRQLWDQSAVFRSPKDPTIAFGDFNPRLENNLIINSRRPHPRNSISTSALCDHKPIKGTLVQLRPADTSFTSDCQVSLQHGNKINNQNAERFWQKESAQIIKMCFAVTCPTCGN